MSKGNPNIFTVAVPIKFKTALQEEKVRLKCYTGVDCMGKILEAYFQQFEDKSSTSEEEKPTIHHIYLDRNGNQIQ